MKALRNYLDKIKPNFEEGGKLHAFRSVFDGFETFLFVPNSTSKTGVHIHDAIDSKRIMSMVVIALIPALLFGMYNVGYQHFLAVGQEAGFFEKFIYGFLAVLPKIIVSYVVGLGIEFVVAQWKNEEIQEGFLVSGLLIPMIVPVECPLWILAVATAFSVIFAKEVFGGTGMNIFNPALITRAFLFFAYPAKMSGDAVWVSTDSIFGIGGGQVVDGFTGATMLGQAATAAPGASELINVNGTPATMWDMVVGLIPGSIGETSVIAIALGAIILLWTGVASWKTMISVFAGGIVMGLIFNVFGSTDNMMAQLLGTNTSYWAVSASVPCSWLPTCDFRTYGKGQVHLWLPDRCDGYRYPCVESGLSRRYDACHPADEHLAPLIDYCIVQKNITARENRLKSTNN